MDEDGTWEFCVLVVCLVPRFVPDWIRAIRFPPPPAHVPEGEVLFAGPIFMLHHDASVGRKVLPDSESHVTDVSSRWDELGDATYVEVDPREEVRVHNGEVGSCK